MSTEVVAGEDVRYRTLYLLAKTFDDIQRARKRVGNRVGAYRERSMGQFGGTEQVLEELRILEENADKALVEAYLNTAPPGIVNWQQQTPGIGEHLMALFLGVVGDPLMAYPKRIVKVPEDRRKHNTGRKVNNVVPDGPPKARTVSRLRAYCGYGAPLRRRRASATQAAMTGEEAKALGNTHAKVIVWNMTKSVILNGNPRYRATYDAAKADKQNLLEPWRPAHAEAHAYRIVSKQIILDIWVAAGGVPTPSPKSPMKVPVKRATKTTAEAKVAKKATKKAATSKR